MSDPDIPPQQGDEQQLFDRYAERLRRLTRLTVQTSPEIVEDACSLAWLRLLTHQPRRDTVFPWLRTVARREAIKLDGAARGLQTMDEERTGSDFPQLVPNRGDVDEAQAMLELRERLAELPARQREVLLLHAAGWTYEEIGQQLGVSNSRVDQLMSRASTRMREMDILEQDANSPRAQRLRELERAPHAYLTASIGNPPRPSRKQGGEQLLREWKRLTLAIEDYRETRGISDRALPLGPETKDPAQATLARRISSFRHQRGLGHGLER